MFDFKNLWFTFTLLTVDGLVGSLCPNPKINILKREIQPNLPKNCKISALFRTLIAQKVLNRIQLTVVSLSSEYLYIDKKFCCKLAYNTIFLYQILIESG